MPKMRGEKIRTAYYRFPGQNLKKELIFIQKEEPYEKKERFRFVD
jgi:hypothetical protein